MKVESLVDMTTRFIEKLIITDELTPGQQIKEDEIADRLDISRPPVREAFKTLEGQGLVIRKPRRGTFVVELFEKDIWEVYTLKAELYALATSLAMDNITDKQKNYLLSLVNKMNKIVETTECDILKYQKIHGLFHITIMEIAGNNRLQKIASNLHKQIRRFSYQTLHHKEHLEASSTFHTEIVEMIIEDKKDIACRLMKEHVIEAMHFLLSIPDVFNEVKDKKVS